MRYLIIMARIHWTVWTCGRRVVERLKLQLFIMKLALCSLFYNEFADKYYVGDTCMEPMFWFVDHFTKFLGPICVVGVILLMLSIIIIAYTIGLSFWWRQGTFPTLLLMSVGHWLLFNVIFHYYMAYITLPGFPPEGALIPEAVSICKKCIAPKPPRTHHCSVCNRCILKMDHHCPWLNNCIGHYNHRYFFLFCVYVWLSVIFVMLFGIPVAWEHYFQEYEPMNTTSVSSNMDQVEGGISVSVFPSTQEYDFNSTNYKRTWSEAMYHSCIVYAALLCFAVFVAVGALLAWHSCLISRGETSIEGHINKKEQLRLLKEGKKYKNPYDFGLKKNWRLFLGIHSGRTWWHILLPSTHKPEGDGLRWHTQENIRWHDDHIWKKEMLKS